MPTIEIDGETADRIVACSIKDSINQLQKEIINLKKVKPIGQWEKKQIGENLIDIDALLTVYFYYTGKEYKYEPGT